MVTVKYIFIILYADNEGEGGTFSCYSLLTRYVSLTQAGEGKIADALRHTSPTETPGNKSLFAWNATCPRISAP